MKPLTSWHMLVVNSIAPLFRKRERTYTGLAGLIVTPTHALQASAIVFLLALWPLLTLWLGRPTSWFGDLTFLFCAMFSILGAPALCLATFMDLVRRGLNTRLIGAFLMSLAGIAAIAAFIYLRLHQYEIRP